MSRWRFSVGFKDTSTGRQADGHISCLQRSNVWTLPNFNDKEKTRGTFHGRHTLWSKLLLLYFHLFTLLQIVLLSLERQRRLACKSTQLETPLSLLHTTESCIVGILSASDFKIKFITFFFIDPWREEIKGKMFASTGPWQGMFSQPVCSARINQTCYGVILYILGWNNKDSARLRVVF